MNNGSLPNLDALGDSQECVQRLEASRLELLAAVDAASDSVLFGHRHLFFRNFIAQNGRPGRIPYNDLVHMAIHRAGDGELMFGENLISNISGSGLSAADFFSLIRDLQKRLKFG